MAPAQPVPAAREGEPGREVPVGQALQRVADSVRKVADDRLELLKFDVREGLRDEVREVGFALAALPFAWLAWLAANASLAFVLAPHWGWPSALAALALGNGALAGAAVAVSRRAGNSGGEEAR